MRHRCKVHHLGKPADQRKALLRSLATSLFTHDEIVTTLVRAKALKEQADRIITLAKRGDVHAIRQVRKLIFHTKKNAKSRKPFCVVSSPKLVRALRNVKAGIPA
jgi:ribosomal protein L17